MSQASYMLSSIPGPDDITRVELANGIVVLARPNFNSPSITISGSLAVGSLFDPEEKLGLADFTASALMRGTQSKDFQQIYDLIETAGARMMFSGGTHTSGFGGKSLVEDLDLLLGLIADVLQNPAFPETQVERLRANIMTGLDLRAQDTGDRAAMAFDELVYAGHPYAKCEEGYPETVRKITRADLEAFHKKHYGPAGMHIAVVGGINPQEAVEKVEAALGSWRNPQQPPVPALPELQPLAARVDIRVPMPAKSQSDIVIGVAGPERAHPQYLAAAVGNNILGEFGMMGRIGESVRERSGLAYYAYSSMGGGLGPGPWAVFAGVDPKDEEKAVDLILAEVSRFAAELVTEEELADTKTNFIGRMPLGLESNGGVAGVLLNIEKHALGLDYYRRFPDLVREVSREDIRRAAETFLHTDAFAVAVAGPPRDE